MTLLRLFKGKKSEDAAVNYLKQRGIVIKKRNYRCALGEVDIIADDKGILVFVEVRSRSSNRFGLPQESINNHKITRIRKVAQHYLVRYGLHNIDCRFDVMAVTLDSHGNIKKIEHIENAF